MEDMEEQHHYYVCLNQTDTPNNLLDSDDCLLQYRAGYIGLVLAFTLIIIFAFLGNSAILLVFMVERKFRLPVNYFILSIAVSDWIMAVAVAPLSMVSAIERHWVFSFRSCQMYAFATLSLGLVSLLSHGAIALDRYFVITRSISVVKLNNKVAGLLVSATWIWAFLWAFFPLVGWSDYSYEGLQTWCSVTWSSSDGDSLTISYVLCLFFFTYIISLSCIIFCYTSIYHCVRQSSLRLRSHSMTENDRMDRKELKRETKVLRVVVCIAVTYFVAWTPYSIVGLWATFGDSAKIPVALVTSASMCGKASTAFNPWVYTATNKVFRKSIQKLWKRMSLLPSEIPSSTTQRSKDTIEMQTTTKEKKCMLSIPTDSANGSSSSGQV